MLSRFAHWILSVRESAQYIFPPATSRAIPVGLSNPVTRSWTPVPSRFAHLISRESVQYIFPPAISKAICHGAAKSVTRSCTPVPSRFARWIFPTPLTGTLTLPLAAPLPIQYICAPLVSIADISSSERVNSHSRTLPSPHAVAKVLPSGLKTACLTQDGCSSVSICSLSSTSHSRTVLSSLPLASIAASGLNATPLTS